MTASEAPKKLYFGKDDKGILDIYSTKDSDNDEVEYIRTDAFIEKAYEFFDERLWEYIDVKSNCDTFISIDNDNLREDFKNYMKGE